MEDFNTNIILYFVFQNSFKMKAPRAYS